MIRKFIELCKEVKGAPDFKWRYLITRRWHLSDGQLLTTYQYVKYLTINNYHFKREA